MLIEYLPSLLSHAIQFFSCFISYSHEDNHLRGGCTIVCRVVVSGVGSTQNSFYPAMTSMSRQILAFASGTKCCSAVPHIR
jgi:hypothetical protein